MINSKDISVVIQGKNVKGMTVNLCKSIRRWLPDAEIIFSTYTNEYVSDLDVDILVESQDPGATLLFANMYNNTNRILTTTKEGLKKANRLYCIKMRSDLLFDNDKILNDIANQFPERNKKYTVFKKRVVFYPLWTRKTEVIASKYFLETPFHLSDWFMFGLTEDIKAYFSKCPITNEPEYSEYYKKNEHRLLGFYDSNVCWCFPPEQWFCMNFFKEYFPNAAMECSQDVSPENIELSKHLLANNIIIAGYNEIGVYIQKKEYKKVSKLTHKPSKMIGKWLDGVYTHFGFLNDYKKYCDPNFILPFRYRWQDEIGISKYVVKLKKHYNKFALPFKSFLHWLLEPISIILYIIMILINSLLRINRLFK